MDNTDEIRELASTAPAAPEDRGAGGKLRKPPPRKPPASPYARPPANASRRWISKLVDPAYRLISGGATRFLPSFLSTPASAFALPSPPSATQDQGKWRTGEQCNKGDPIRSDLPVRNVFASYVSVYSVGA